MINKLRFGYKTDTMTIDVGFGDLVFLLLKMMITNILMTCHQIVQQKNRRNAKRKNTNQKNAGEFPKQTGSITNFCHSVAK